MNHYFVICDQEKDYVDRFTAFLNRQASVPYQIEGMTDRASLEVFCREHRVEVLLIEEELYEKRPPLQAKRIFQLTSLPFRQGESVLFKYQPVPALMEKILQVPGETGPEKVSRVQILGVYSPVRAVQKTLFALAMGQILAKEQATLYVGFEGFSGLHQLLDQADGQDLSDILYLVKQDRIDPKSWQENCIHTIENLDYILPPVSPMDLQCVEEKTVLSVVGALENCGRYQTILLDLQEGMPAFLQLLQKCSVIYMPTGEDLLSKSQQLQYEQLLQSAGQKAVLQKTVLVKPPYYNGFGDKSRYVEELVWGQLGDYVRGLLRGG